MGCDLLTPDLCTGARIISLCFSGSKESYYISGREDKIHGQRHDGGSLRKFSSEYFYLL